MVSDLAISKPRPAKGGKGGKRQGGGLLAALLQDEPAVGKPPPAAALQGLEFCKRFEPIGDFTGGTFTGHVVAMHADGRVRRWPLCPRSPLHHTPDSTLHTPPHSTLPHTLPTRHPPTRHPATQPRLTSLTSLTSRGISCGTRTRTRSTSPSRRLPRHRNPPPLDHPLTTPDHPLTPLATP